MSGAFARVAAEGGLRHDDLRYGALAEQVVEVLARHACPPDADTPGSTGVSRESGHACPNEASPRPLVVVIHGGFWRAEYDRTHTASQCAALAAAGYVVAALEYRRVGNGGGWPATFADVAAGLDALPDLLGGRIEAGRTVLVGHSAGGHLALWAAARHRLPSGAPGHRADPPPIRAVLSLAGVVDLGWAARAGLGGGAVDALLAGDDPTSSEARLAAADPATLLPTGITSICLHGADDDLVPVECAISYVRAATEAGDTARLRAISRTGHFDLIDPTSNAWPHVLAAVADLMH
ncbi:MAG: alpha/beta hydrolase family protein [Sporichthyaceae bacterium]